MNELNTSTNNNNLLESLVKNNLGSDKKATSKKDLILNMLKTDDGATIKSIITATGWQEHSVRGALGNLKNKEGFKIISTKTDGQDRVYKIEA